MKSPKADPNQRALDMRNSRIQEFNEAISRVLQLKTEISSFDFVLGQLNPEHQAYEFNRDAFFGPTISASVDVPFITATPLAKTTPTAAPQKEPKVQAAIARVKPSRGKAKGKKSKTKKPSDRAKVAASIIHGEAADARGNATSEAISETRTRRSIDNENVKNRDSRAILNTYFKGKNPQQEIVNILRGMSEPVTADAVGNHFRSIHPINLDQAPALKALFKSRIQAQLAALMTKKSVNALNVMSPDGKRTLRHYKLTGNGKKAVIAETKPDIPQNEAPQPETSFAPEQSSGLAVSF